MDSKEIQKIISRVQSEKKQTEKEIASSEGLIRLQEIMAAYDGEDKLYTSAEIVEQMKHSPTPVGYKTGTALDDLTGGFRKQQIITMFAHTKHGKCLQKGTGVIMFDGTVKKVEELEVGELLMGIDSKPRLVLSLARGKEEMFEVTQGNDSYTVNKSHILSLKKTGIRTTEGKYTKGEIVNLSVVDYLGKSQAFKHTHKGWRCAVDFKEQPITIDPYFLGVWLGDGTTSGTSVTNMEPEIEEYMQRYADFLGMKLRKVPQKSNAFLYSISRKSHRDIGFSPSMRAIGVIGNKHIPKQYLINTREIRLKVLAGIIDTDGYLTKNKWPWYEVTLKSSQLANDVVFLARSLGFGVTTAKCTKGIKRTGFVGEYNRIRISGDLSTIPLLVKRKKSNYKCTKDVLTSAITVTPKGVGEYYGFTLDGDGLFLLSNFIVTHNTETGMWLMSLWKELNPVYIPLEQKAEEVISQRMERGYNIPHFLAPIRSDAFVLTEWIEERIVEGIAKYNSQMVVIDHLGYIDTNGKDGVWKRENLPFRIGQVMKQLHHLAGKWDVMIILLSHISEGDEGRPPQLIDLANSSDIKKESDTVISIWRKNKLQNKIRVHENKTMLSVLANRRFGKTGHVGLSFNDKTGMYYEDNEWVKRMEEMAIAQVNADENY